MSDAKKNLNRLFGYTLIFAIGILIGNTPAAKLRERMREKYNKIDLSKVVIA